MEGKRRPVSNISEPQDGMDESEGGSRTGRWWKRGGERLPGTRNEESKSTRLALLERVTCARVRTVVPSAVTRAVGCETLHGGYVGGIDATMQW